jgi:hypothetical protein
MQATHDRPRLPRSILYARFSGVAALLNTYLWFAATVLVTLRLWLLGPFGDRADSGLAYALLALALAAVLLYRKSRRGRDWWPDSIMEKSSNWSAFVSEGMLIGLGSFILPGALALDPHQRWSGAVFAISLVLSFAAHCREIVRSIREMRGFGRVILEERRRLGSFRAAFEQESTPELEARIDEAVQRRRPAGHVHQERGEA